MDHALIVTAAMTGMRQGELLGLRWEDVDLRRATLTVRHSLSRLPGHRYVLTEPKTERSRRTIPLLPPVVAALTELRRAQMDGPSNQGLVFCDEDGLALDATLVTRRFQRTLAAAGLPKVTFHSLRHAAASLMIEAGVDLATVSAILGHSTIIVTVNTYAHLTETHRRGALLKLQEAIG